MGRPVGGDPSAVEWQCTGAPLEGTSHGRLCRAQCVLQNFGGVLVVGRRGGGRNPGQCRGEAQPHGQLGIAFYQHGGLSPCIGGFLVRLGRGQLSPQRRVGGQQPARPRLEPTARFVRDVSRDGGGRVEGCGHARKTQIFLPPRAEDRCILGIGGCPGRGSKDGPEGLPDRPLAQNGCLENATVAVTRLGHDATKHHFHALRKVLRDQGETPRTLADRYQRGGYPFDRHVDQFIALGQKQRTRPGAAGLQVEDCRAVANAVGAPRHGDIGQSDEAGAARRSCFRGGCFGLGGCIFRLGRSRAVGFGIDGDGERRR